MSWLSSDETVRVLIGVAVWLSAFAGVLLTAFTLPGIWFMLLVAGLAQWFTHARHDEPMFSYWTLGVCLALAVVAEIVEMIASAFGASKAGGSKKAAIASVVGALIGAIVGTIVLAFLPIIGTVIGAAAGAGLAALLTEKHLGEKTWKQAGRVGAGAAVGRLAATVAKVGFAIVVALILGIDTLV